MKDRIDPLIAERAPWLFGPGHLTRVTRRMLEALLGYDATLRLAEDLADRPATDIMRRMGGRLAQHVDAAGLGRIPRQGACLVVANHPTGIADGIILHSLIAPLRPDLFFYANSDILRVLPQMESLIAPVEWQVHKRTVAKTRATMAYTRDAIGAGRLGVIFPSGRLAERRGLRLHERPWMASAAMIARKFDLPVVPVNIRARNSILFYLLDCLHPSLRDITLFHETLNKGSYPFKVTVGHPIPPGRLPESADQAIEIMRRETLAAGNTHTTTASVIDGRLRPGPA